MNEPGPFGESGRQQHTLDKLADKMAGQAAEAKEAWLLKLLKGMLPPEILKLGESERPRDRLKFSRWLASNSIRIEERSESTRLMRGAEVMGEFRVTFNQGKLTFEERLPKAKPETN